MEMWKQNRVSMQGGDFSTYNVDVYVVAPTRIACILCYMYQTMNLVDDEPTELPNDFHIFGGYSTKQPFQRNVVAFGCHEVLTLYDVPLSSSEGGRKGKDSAPINSNKVGRY